MEESEGEEERGRSRTLKYVLADAEKDRSKTPKAVERRKLQESLGRFELDPADDDIPPLSLEEEQILSPPQKACKEQKKVGRRSLRATTQRAAEEERKRQNSQKENELTNARIDDLLARQKEKTDESLQALKRLSLKELMFGPGCTCETVCHCIFDGEVGVVTSSPAVVRGWRGAAGLPPAAEVEQNDAFAAAQRSEEETIDVTRLDLSWGGKMPVSKGKMLAEKRDSIRPESHRVAEGKRDSGPSESKKTPSLWDPLTSPTLGSQDWSPETSSSSSSGDSDTAWPVWIQSLMKPLRPLNERWSF